jgi:hypothetical protein
MSSSQQQQHHHTTSMFARVVGPYLVIIAATAALRPIDMKALLSQFEANSLWAWVVGAFILLLGLVTIALHPYWRGAAAVIVSVVGWLVALKGLMLVAFAHTYFSIANSAIDAVGWWRGGTVVYGLIGLYLSYVGWMPQRTRPAPQAAASTHDIQRAA